MMSEEQERVKVDFNPTHQDDELDYTQDNKVLLSEKKVVESSEDRLGLTEKRQKPDSSVLLIDDQLFLLLAMESQFLEADVICELR